MLTDLNRKMIRQYREGFEATVQKPFFKELYEEVLAKKAVKLQREHYKVNRLIKAGWVGECDRDFLLFTTDLNSLLYKLNKATQKDREIMFYSVLAGSQKSN